jgi:hypothetical protein
VHRRRLRRRNHCNKEAKESEIENEANYVVKNRLLSGKIVLVRE